MGWRNAHQLRDPERCSQWLSGIARNLCRNWIRSRERERVFFEDLDTDLDLLAAQDRQRDPADIEVELDRSALVELLDRALALLPPETRAVLIQRYVENSPYAEIAARQGLSEDAVAMRISRGKLALRRALSTQLADDAAAFGLVDPSATTWQATHIWCPLCGSHHLHGRLDPAEGLLCLRCPHCSPPDRPLVSSGPADSLPVKTYKPALTRLLAWIHEYYQAQASAGSVRCLRCGRRIPLRFGAAPAAFRIGQPPRTLANSHGIYAWCERCEFAAGLEEWWSLTLSQPAVREFWVQHPRMRALPQREIQYQGCGAIVTGFESVTADARIEVVFSHDTFAVLSVLRLPSG
ncbi:MAG TPA: sigma-70 family RNA polymerase sigma factor [Roseiflexaceae bacterium]|nr:sigma-70 family RNA polymerase sigma factor [Roseiflexaceae bacterium]